MSDNPRKPIGRKNYGSIPHLSGSKLEQQADKKIEMGQELILTKKARDYKDLVIVQEKLDGSNVGVANTENGLVALTRSGLHCDESRFEHHRQFAQYVAQNEFRWKRTLMVGERICGEWMTKTISLKYHLYHEPFVAFDIIDTADKERRLEYLDFIRRCDGGDLITANLVHIGQPISVKNAMKALGPRGAHGCLEEPEGLVYRVEREGKVDFLAKYVRPGKIDGLVMDEDVWNEGYAAYAQRDFEGDHD